MKIIKSSFFFALVFTHAALSGCVDPYSGGGGYNGGYGGGYGSPGYGGYGGYGGYDRYDYDREYDRRERRELERERRRIEEERRRLDEERRREQQYRPPPPPPQPTRRPEQERCPSGFSPSENKCSAEERRRGCQDMRLPGGLGCVKR